MFINYDFLNAIKDNPDLLKKFVELHNHCEEDYDVEFYDEILDNITKADNAYIEFEREVKRHLFVPSQE